MWYVNDTAIKIYRKDFNKKSFDYVFRIIPSATSCWWQMTSDRCTRVVWRTKEFVEINVDLIDNDRHFVHSNFYNDSNSESKTFVMHLLIVKTKPNKLLEIALSLLVFNKNQSASTPTRFQNIHQHIVRDGTSNHIHIFYIVDDVRNFIFHF